MVITDYSIKGIITLMSGVEYAAYLSSDTFLSPIGGGFLQCQTADGKSPIVFNLQGVLMVREATEEEFSTWLTRQRHLEALQDRRIRSALDGDGLINSEGNGTE